MVDRLTIERAVDRGLQVPDVGEACAMGEGLRHMLGALPSENNPPDRALVLAEATSALCAERRAWEADLMAARARRATEQGAPLADAIDARLAADRHHTEAAARFDRSWNHLVTRWGLVEDACPKIRKGDEIVFLVGLVAGTLALLHDKEGGSVVGIPTDRLGQVARAAQCLDDTRWWGVPSALAASAWATIPGSGPEGSDPWALLEASALRGEAEGMRVARALQVRIAGNAGRLDVLRSGMAAHAQALSSRIAPPEHTLLDAYATSIARHQSDLVWIAETGHRTEAYGTWPEAPASMAPTDDPFAP